MVVSSNNEFSAFKKRSEPTHDQVVESDIGTTLSK